MKTSFSLLSFICIVSLIALSFALFSANRRNEETEARLAVVESESLLLRKRLGKQAADRKGQYSICFFSDAYTSSDELRWRIKVPENGSFRLMYANETASESGTPKNGRELRLNDTGEFVLAVEFTESHLQMRMYSEKSDGTQAAPRRATSLQGEGWLKSLASPKRHIWGLDSDPQFFTLEEPLKILELSDETNTQLTIWMESRILPTFHLSKP